jgi:lipoprotein NlpI
MFLRAFSITIFVLAVAIAAAAGQTIVKATPGPANPQKNAYERGSDALKRGDLEGAIIHYTRAIELDPKNAKAFAGRGVAKREKGDLEGALADLNSAIVLDSNMQSSYYTRAWVNLVLNHGNEAYADAIKLLSFRESNPMLFPSHVLIAYFGLRQARRDPEADAFLKTTSSKLFSTLWTTQIIRYLKHEISDEQLIAAASGKKAMIEARTYVGMDQSLGGQKAVALTNLRWVAANGDKRVFEYALAAAEIRRIESPAVLKN